MSSNKNEKESNIDTLMGPQLGSDARDLSHGQVNIDRLAIMTEAQVGPTAYFSDISPYLGGGWALRHINKRQNLSISIDGTGRKQLIQIVGASKGNNAAQVVPKPNIIARVLDRDWKKKYDEKGWTVQE